MIFSGQIWHTDVSRDAERGLRVREGLKVKMNKEMTKEEN
jgi:hypothetical protein